MNIAGNIAEKLIALGHPMLAPSASVLFRSGDTSDGAYLLVAGRVDLSLLNREGTTLWSRQLESGSLFGLAAAIKGSCQELCACTDADSSLVFVQRESLLQMMRSDLSVGNEVLRLMSLELIDARRKLAMFNGSVPPQPRL